jgi:hypothetical protein
LRAFLVLALAALAWAAGSAAQGRPLTAERLVQDASRALQGDNAALFLSCFDRDATPDFERLRESVVALLDQKNAASSIDVIKRQIDGEQVRLEVDWLLQLTPKRQVGTLDARRATLQLTVDVSRKKPKITSLEPIDFFRPL